MIEAFIAVFVCSYCVLVGYWIRMNQEEIRMNQEERRKDSGRQG